MKNLLEYFGVKDIRNLKKSESFKKHIKKLEKHQKCKIKNYGISGECLTLYSDNDVFRWRLKADKLMIVGHGSLHSVENDLGNYQEVGSASITIDLSDGDINVSHGETNDLLYQAKNVKNGTWDSLWDFIRKIETIKKS